jgi:hypothetical protein
MDDIAILKYIHRDGLMKTSKDGSIPIEHLKDILIQSLSEEEKLCPCDKSAKAGRVSTCFNCTGPDLQKWM